MTFLDTHDRLLVQVRDRLRNGELTERSLARHLGISQPHVNNVLQGRRKLSPELADRLLNFLNVSVLDLYADRELHNNLHARIRQYTRGDVVGTLKSAIGPGHPWASTTDGFSRYRCPVPVGNIPSCTMFARIEFDECMPGVLMACDIALIDTSIEARLEDYPGGVYVVHCRGGTCLRWIRSGSRTMYLAHEMSLNRPLEWELLAIEGNQRLEIVKGRVLWLGAESGLQRP